MTRAAKDIDQPFSDASRTQKGKAAGPSSNEKAWIRSQSPRDPG
jgi:hypothetical protein